MRHDTPVRTALAEAHSGDHPRFTASFGVTDSTRGDTFDALLRIADSGLYQAKNQGRDRVVLASGGIGPVHEPHPNLTSTDLSGSGLLIPRRPALHQVVDEEEPRATGVEIR